jgi:hypothetical protein
MHTSTSSFFATLAPPAEYEAAMADVERRVLAGRLTLAQAKQEIFALRDVTWAEANKPTAQVARRAMLG